MRVDMGVPSEKASNAARRVLAEVDYIDRVSYLDIFEDTVENLTEARAIIDRILAKVHQ